MLLSSSAYSISSVGPAAFLMMQQMEILRTVILIGDTQNEYIEDVLSASINIFALNIVP